MIDWIISKLGLLIFVIVCVGLLGFFALVQMDVWNKNKEVHYLNNIVKVLNGICDGCSTYLSFDRNLNITCSEHILYVNNHSRATVQNISCQHLNTKKIRIEKKDGVVHVTSA